MSRPIKNVPPAPELPPREHARLAHTLTSGHDPSEIERIQLLDDIAVAEQQLDRGEGVEHEAAKAELLRRLRR